MTGRAAAAATRVTCGTVCRSRTPGIGNRCLLLPPRPTPGTTPPATPPRSAPAASASSPGRCSASRSSGRARNRRCSRSSPAATPSPSPLRFGQVRDLPGAGQLLDGPMVVVSPLIALQRDQVERLAEIEDRAGRAAQLNSTMSAGDQQEVLEALSDGAGPLRLPGARAAGQARGGRRRLARPGRRCSWSTRRTACRPGGTTSGPTTCGWAGSSSSSATPRARADRHRGTAGPRRDRRAAGDARRRRSWSRGSTGRRSGSRSTTTPTPRASSRACSTGSSARSATAAGRASSTAPPQGHRGDRRGAHRAGACASGRTTPGWRRPSARTPSGPGWTDELDVVVATTAFGMGIDKPGIRFVVHAEPADSLDSYYQEIGRAGRDGHRPLAVLVYRQEDLGLRRFFAAGTPAEEELQQVAGLVQAAAAAGIEDGVDVKDLREETGRAPRPARPATSTCWSRSRRASRRGGRCPPGRRRTRRRARPPRPPRELAEHHERVDQSRVEMMRGYAETTELPSAVPARLLRRAARRAVRQLRAHLRGGHRRGAARPDADDTPFPVETPVEHTEWGPGVVMRVEDDRLVGPLRRGRLQDPGHRRGHRARAAARPGRCRFVLHSSGNAAITHTTGPAWSQRAGPRTRRLSREGPRHQRPLPRPRGRTGRRRRDRRGRRGGALQPPQARQATAAVARLGATGARPPPGAGPGRPRRPPTSTRSPTPSTRG